MFRILPPVVLSSRHTTFPKGWKLVWRDARLSFRGSVPDIVCFICDLGKALGLLAPTPLVPEKRGVCALRGKVRGAALIRPLDGPWNTINLVFWTYTAQVAASESDCI